MPQNQYVKYGTLSGLLLLCIILLNTTEDNSRLALAQITPAPEKFGSTEESSTNSSPETGDGNDDDQNDGSTGSSGADGADVSEDVSSSDEATEEDSTEISDSNDENDGQSTIEEPATSEDTNPLREVIIKQVNDALSASGIPGL
jgi:hypothetical protein